jgi:hypothetical protein
MAAYEGEVLNEKPQQVSGAVVPTAVDFEAEYKAKADKLKEDYDKKVKELTTSTLKVGPETYEIPSALTSPVGLLAGGALLAGGGYLAGKAIYDKTASALDGIKNRMINKGPDLSAPTPTAQQPVTEKPKSTFAQQFETTYGVPLSKAEELTGGPITNPKDAAIVGGALKNQGGISVNNPYQLSPYTQPTTGPFFNPVAPAAPQATAPVAPVAPADPFAPRPNPYMNPSVDNPYMTPSVQESVATGNTAQAVQTVVAQELDKATGVAPTEKPAPKAKKPIDPSEVGLTKQEIGMKRYLESFYGGGEVGAKTYGQVGEILGYRPAFEPGKGGGLKPEENLVIKGYRKENIAGPKVNLDKEMKKALKGGAGAAALLSIPGFADAAQRKDYGRMVDIASDFVVPPFAGSSELGVSTLGQQQMQNVESSALLGSPYAQTEWAKNQRLKEKAGAGRGIAPPSAYMR